MKCLLLPVPVSALAAGLLVFLLGASAAFAEQRLVYEREFSMISGGENTLRIVVYGDGRISVDRPAFMTHAGEYRGVVSEAMWTDLAAAMHSIDFSSRALAEDLRQRSRNELFVVTDPEYSRFGLFEGDRVPAKAVEVESLAAYAQRFSDDRLEHLRELELQLLELMGEVIEGGRS